VADVLGYATVIAGGYACKWVFATGGRTANAEGNPQSGVEVSVITSRSSPR
jgi:hypothetical protein